MVPQLGSRNGTSSREGLTLLEVLISCGLLIVGLTTMAAMLPSASHRLTQATTADQAGLLLSNATAEIYNRGLLSAAAFPLSGPTANAAGRSLVFGETLGVLATFGAFPTGHDAAAYFAQPSEEVHRRSGSPRTFVLEDGLIYGPPRFTESPENVFTTAAGGSLGPRPVREGLRWGAMLTPRAYPARAGGSALLSIAIFKQPTEAQPGQTTSIVPVWLNRAAGFYEADLLDEGGLLRGCSWVLAIPPAPGQAPRWFKIMSSWTWPTPAGPATRLVLQNQEDFADLTGSSASGTKAAVIAFEGLVNLNETSVTID